MNKFLNPILGVLLVLLMIAGVSFYKSEVEKNKLLRAEHAKTVESSQAELKKLQEEVKKDKDKNLEDRQKLLEQITQLSKEKEAALEEKEEIKKRFSGERDFSIKANEDLNKLRIQMARFKSQDRQARERLEQDFKKKQQEYDTRILSLEAQLTKAKNRLKSDAERYHYNLGVVYTKNKEYDLAVDEFKAAIGYNPKNANAHYNLGIIFDDYFKDKENARYHYRAFLELSPVSDDADSVKEWLKNLDSPQKR